MSLSDENFAVRAVRELAAERDSLARRVSYKTELIGRMVEEYEALEERVKELESRLNDAVELAALVSQTWGDPDAWDPIAMKRMADTIIRQDSDWCVRCGESGHTLSEGCPTADEASSLSSRLPETAAMLRKQIDEAQRRLAEIPEWMRRLMYFEGGDKTGLNKSPFDTPPETYQSTGDDDE